MKKLGILIIVLISLQTNAQVWFEAAFKGTYGFTGFLNKNIMDDGRVNYKLTSGLAYGGRFGVNFGYYNGISIEALLADNTQKFDVQGQNGGPTVNYDINWKAVDLYLLYRLYGNKTFLEIGPKLSQLRSINQTPTPGSLVKGADYKDYWSGALGFGTYIFGVYNFSMMLGARFEYSFQDLVGDSGKEKNLPLYTLPAYETYKASSPFTAKICLEFNFGLGYFAKAACGRRGFFFKYDSY